MRAQQKQLRKEIDDFTARRTEKDGEIEALQQANDSFEAKVAELKKRHADKKADMVKNQNELEQVASSMRTRNQTLVEKLEKRRQELEIIEKQNAAFAEKHASLEAKNETFSNQLKLMSEKPNELATQNDRLKSLVSSMKDQNQTLSESNEGLNQQIVKLAEKSQELQAKNETLTAEVSKLKAKINSSPPAPEPSSNNSKGSRKSDDTDRPSIEDGLKGDAGLDRSLLNGQKEFEGATELENAGSQMGFAVSNPTKATEAIGLTTGSNAADSSVDTANDAAGFMADSDMATNPVDNGNEAGGLLRQNVALYGVVAVILTLLALAFAWTLRS